MCKEIKKCRICGNPNLVKILDLGNPALTGVFPKTREQEITSGPLEIVKCQEKNKDTFCGLLQLRHSYERTTLYNENYGYRSGLNPSMAGHLQKIVKKILGFIDIAPGDVVLDIGSNDGTLLRAYPKDKFVLIGIDPIGNKLKEQYPRYIQLVSDFFCAEKIKKHLGDRKAKAVTSIAMFYDLESPLDFMRQVHEILDDEGIWVFEQSYMPSMLERNAYDTICHEHLEYYGIKQIKWMTDRIGFKIIDIEVNDVNGGSLFIIAAKSRSSFRGEAVLLNKLLSAEKEKNLHTLTPYRKFRQRVYRHRQELLETIRKIKADDKIIIGWGASTKGNVLLQFCEFSEKDIPFIAEVNKDKIKCFTPGTRIPIISEEEAKAMHPDYLFILPWHFKDHFLKKEKEYLNSGGRLLFPLPAIKIINKGIVS